MDKVELSVLINGLEQLVGDELDTVRGEDDKLTSQHGWSLLNLFRGDFMPGRQNNLLPALRK
jgi:hypothetical protein